MTISNATAQFKFNSTVYSPNNSYSNAAYGTANSFAGTSTNNNNNNNSNILFGHVEIKQEKQEFEDLDATLPPQIIPKTRTVRKNGKLVSEKHYGPIVVRPRKNPAPTLASGRKSKYAQLTSEEEYRREVRRRRNRLAAEKCKVKRNEIEEKLEADMVHLHHERMSIERENQTLMAQKQRLEKLLNEHTQSCGGNSNAGSGVTNIVIANIDYQTNTQITYLNSQANTSQSEHDSQAYFSGQNDSYSASSLVYANGYPAYDQHLSSNLSDVQHQQQQTTSNFQSPPNGLFYPRQTPNFQYNQFTRYV